MIGEIIAGFFRNFSLVMLIAGLVVGVGSYAAQGKNSDRSLAEQLFRWTALLGVGLPGLYTFVMHVFFATQTAEHIGWQPSPFQYEVGMADLTIGVLGTLAFWPNFGFRLATVIATVCWLGGDAVGHVRQMIVAHNYAPGNAGSWFWTDVLVPALMVALIVMLDRLRRGAAGRPSNGSAARGARQLSF
jgi:hypothetical protein